MVYVYVSHIPPTSTRLSETVINVGTIAHTSNTGGQAGWIWQDGGLSGTPADSIAKVFTDFVSELLKFGVKMGFRFAAGKLAQSFSKYGLSSIARKVPGATSKAGGLAVNTVLTQAIYYVLKLLVDEIFKKYHLVVNIYNFDSSHQWQTLGWHGDNAVTSDGEWTNEIIPKFMPAGSGVPKPPFLRFNPPADNVVSYISYSFENNWTGAMGLGVGILLTRKDNNKGLAIKYEIPWGSRHNKLGLQVVNTKPSQFALHDYLADSSSWAPGSSQIATSDGLNFTGRTPALSGNADDRYEYDINIGVSLKS